MKLVESRPFVETSGKLEEQFFSIQDQGMLFDILRNKMYSNPINAICREISCNARDAHREVGTPEVPVEIHLPNALDPHFKIKDFGPGISPDRVKNIFIKYTASTKREDNIQTGGFGLGSKTPFSYSDSFSVVTINGGYKYNYACIIDETKVGKIILLSKNECKDKSGTEIIIPIKQIDFNAFADGTEKSTRHWDVKPIIKGRVIDYKNFKKVLEGSNWAIITNTGEYDLKIIVDGIQYSLAFGEFKDIDSSKLLSSCRGNLNIYFDVGQISLSSNREQIYLDKSTKDKITKRLLSISNEIKNNVSSKIDSFDNLWQANSFYGRHLNDVFSNLSFLGTLTWKGLPITAASHYSLPCTVYHFTRGKYSYKYGTQTDKLSRSITRHISFADDASLYINDLAIKEVTPKHVKKAFESDSKLRSLQLICPDATSTEEVLNKNYSLDKMSPKLLSDLTSASTKLRAIPISRLIMFKYNFMRATFDQVTYDSISEDKNKKILCKLIPASYPSNTREIFLEKNKKVTGESLRALMKNNNTLSFYGIYSDTPESRIKKDLAGFQSMDDFIQSAVDAIKTIDYNAVKIAVSNYGYSNSYGIGKYEKFGKFDKIKSLITNTDSFYMKRVGLIEEMRKLVDNYKQMLNMYESINGEITGAILNKYREENPEYDFEKMDKEFYKKYPLLEFLNVYTSVDLSGQVAQYVNLIDNG